VRYNNVYPGIDLVYYGARGRLEFDFELAAGANPQAIQFRWDGSRRLKLDREGNLIVLTPWGHFSFRKPVIYQSDADNGKHYVSGSYRISAEHTVHFELGHYDRAKPLVIDPILDYSTYLGPISAANAVAVDSAGEAYVTGNAPNDFPVTTGAFQTKSANTNQSAYVAKFNSTGTALLYSTFLSGNVYDSADAIAVDAAGNAYIAGGTVSSDFPVTSGAFQTTNRSAAPKESGFVTELNSTGTALLYSTYLGGSTSTQITGIAIDSSGSAYVAGFTYDTDFPITAGAYQTAAPAKQIANSSSAFVSKLNPTGTALVYSTYLAGSHLDSANGIAVNAVGNAFVAGATYSFDFPTTPGAFQPTTSFKYGMAFVTEMNANGTGLAYSTYLGGSFGNIATAIAVDASGNAYVTGNTSSLDFPATSGAFQISLKLYGDQMCQNAFITKLNNSGSGLVYSTLLGGSTDGVGGVSTDGGTGIALDVQGNAYVTGTTSGIDFPVTPGALETQNLSQLNSVDAGSFFAKINSNASSLLYSTYLSGSGDQSTYSCDCAAGIALDPSGNAYVVGRTVSVDFPTTTGAVQTAFKEAGFQSFVTKFDGSELKTLPATKVVITSNANSVEYGNPVTFTATVQQTSGGTPTGIVAFNFLGFQAADSDGSGVGMGPWTTISMNGSGVATFTTSLLTPALSTVQAQYLGDGSHAPSSATFTQKVTPIPTTTTLASSANPAVYAAPITLTATVLDNTGKPAKGYVDFLVGNTVYATVTLDSAGQATWMNGTGGPPLSVGAVTVVAEFEPYVGYEATSSSLVENFTPLGAIPPPTFAPPAGTYTSVQQISLTDTTPTAAMYYTTDGSTPVAGTSSVFGGPIQVNASETIQAIAVAPGYTASTIASATYTIHLPPPDFSVSLTPASLSVSPGQAESTIVALSALNGFTQAVALSCSGLPPGISCTFAPTSISSPATSSLTVSASSNASLSTRKAQIPWILVITLAALTGWSGVRRRRSPWVLLFAGLWMLVVLNGCGGGGAASSPGPTPTTSTIMITGVSGGLSHSVQLALTVN
jgi:hypothetical protein